MTATTQKHGRKAKPNLSQKKTRAWTTIPILEIVQIEKNGYVVPDFLAIACHEKMLRDGLLQQ